MKEPKRLLSHGATDFERQLLRAVVSERPSSLLRSRMQRGLGLVGPLAWATNVKAMFGTVTRRAAVSMAVVGAVVAGGFAAVGWLPSSTGDDSLGAAPAHQAQPALGVSVDAVPVDEGQAAVAAAPVDPATAADVGPSDATSGEPPVVDDDSQLREEIALLDSARAAIQRADRETARATLNVYRERFPSGILRREAKLLGGRIDAKVEREAASEE
jgi:hypothetical protein